MEVLSPSPTWLPNVSTTPSLAGENLKAILNLATLANDARVGYTQ